MSEFKSLIANAIKEDLGNGDHSSLCSVNKNKGSKAQLLVKDQGIIAGLKVAKEVFFQIDRNLLIDFKLKDGDKINSGDIAFIVKGSPLSILAAERLALNFMQRMSGIATYTAKLCKLIEGTKSKILDTRKTTPNFRVFEKEAVRIGGGQNHRFGLYDMIMLKDNHIDYAGGISQAIAGARNYIENNQLDLKIEVEARNLKEVEEILKAQTVDRIMLDNFNYTDLRTAVELIGNKSETEASGGINEETIREYAECGVDFISVGALTHQIKSLDLSLKAI